MAIIASKSLDIIGVDNQIGLAHVDDKVYGHCYIIIGDKSYEPRFMGLYLKSNIDYDNPYKIQTADELINDEGFWPDVSLIIKALDEALPDYGRDRD